MRLRQLATTQSVAFFAPPEVHQSILDLRLKAHGAALDSRDVIYWLLEQTCCGNEQILPLYYAQGLDFCRKAQAAMNSPDLKDLEQVAAYLRVLEHPEAQTLQKLYGLRNKPSVATEIQITNPKLLSFVGELKSMRSGFNDSAGNAVHASALQEVEQEREVAVEAETVRELQKPPHVTAQRHALHGDVLRFAETGRLAPGSAGMEHVFTALRRTAVGLKNGVNAAAVASSKLYVTIDFSRTIHQPFDRPNDNYQRPVNWLIWSTKTETALVISPFEAEQLLLTMRSFDSKHAAAHLLIYAPPTTKKMLRFNNLDVFSIPQLPDGWRPPRWLTVELGIFAGRLYFPFRDYTTICKYLGVKLPSKLKGVGGTDTNGTVTPRRDANGGPTTSVSRQLFTAKPLAFMQEWLAMRRKGQDFAHTPMGYVCQGKELGRDHPFFKRSGITASDDEMDDIEESDESDEAENQADVNGNAVNGGTASHNDTEATNGTSHRVSDEDMNGQHDSDDSDTEMGSQAPENWFDKFKDDSPKANRKTRGKSPGDGGDGEADGLADLLEGWHMTSTSGS